MSVSNGARSCTFGPVAVTYDGAVLEPRPWTLAQSEWVAGLSPRTADGAILELCAGAGHIGLAAAVLTGRALVQVEVDPHAAAFARANAAGAGIADRVRVHVTAVDESLDLGERFPLLIADPPYLRSDAVRVFPDDPVLAIDGGSDGLVVHRACLAATARHLAPGGAAVFQVAGPAQAEELSAIAEQYSLRADETRAIAPDRGLVLVRSAD